MEELNVYELLAKRLAYLCGWFINQIRFMFIGGNTGDPNTIIRGFNSPLLWLTFGLFFAFASLHIFKRILRKG